LAGSSVCKRDFAKTFAVIIREIILRSWSYPIKRHKNQRCKKLQLWFLCLFTDQTILYDCKTIFSIDQFYQNVL